MADNTLRVTKKQQLLDWWASQPDRIAFRSDLVRMYGIIGGQRHEDGSINSNFGKWPHSAEFSCRFHSLTVGHIVTDCGMALPTRRRNPRTGRMGKRIVLTT